MKKTLLSMLLLIAGIVTGQAASYNIWVCGVQVNDTNTPATTFGCAACR